MTVKNFFRLVIAGIMAILSGIIGVQKLKIDKQSTRIDTYAQKLEDKEKENSLYKGENVNAKTTDNIQEKINTDTNKESVKIRESETNEEIINNINDSINDWNTD